MDEDETVMERALRRRAERDAPPPPALPAVRRPRPPRPPVVVPSWALGVGLFLAAWAATVILNGVAP